MLPKPESACFVIADISGYTNFLAAVELDHAQDIIADLMDTVVRGLRPPFRLAKFEGDAAFVYAPTEKADGSLVQDAIESAYFEFRRRMRNIRQASAEFKNRSTQWIQNLRLMLEGQQTSVAIIDEPPLMPSRERFLTEPVQHDH